MPFDQAPSASSPPVTAWTKYADLTPDQRERFGSYVLACERAAAGAVAGIAANERAAAALRACGDDKQKAFAMLLEAL